MIVNGLQLDNLKTLAVSTPCFTEGKLEAQRRKPILPKPHRVVTCQKSSPGLQPLPPNAVKSTSSWFSWAPQHPLLATVRQASSGPVRSLFLVGDRESTVCVRNETEGQGVQAEDRPPRGALSSFSQQFGGRADLEVHSQRDNPLPEGKSQVIIH